MNRHIVSPTYRGAQVRNYRPGRTVTPLLPGQVRCEDCRRGVRLRSDGDMIAHRANGYPCLGGGTYRYTHEHENETIHQEAA